MNRDETAEYVFFQITNSGENEILVPIFGHRRLLQCQSSY